MPIVEVSCQVVRAPLHTPFVTALRRTEHVESLLARSGGRAQEAAHDKQQQKEPR
jgi:hypothetical protein